MKALKVNFIRIALVAAWVACLCGIASRTLSAQEQVSYKTEDGWNIVGTLSMAQGASTPTPAVILISEPGWDDRSIFDSYLAAKLRKIGIATLSLDLRGTGASFGKREFERFAPSSVEGFQLDIRGAVKFLMADKRIDANRIGIVGTGIAANQAVLEATENDSLRAVVLISGTLSDKARKNIRFREDIPFLALAGKKDGERVREMADVLYHSRNDNSDFLFGIGHGAVMFSHSPNLEEQVVGWLDKNLNGLGVETPVTFQSKDGWTLQGFLHTPPLKNGAKAPVVVLVHGAKHDLQTYTLLASELAKRGIAALRFDWRGKARSIDPKKGQYGVNTESVSPENIYLDVKAAIEFAASQKSIDSSRIALVAATLGTNHALRAALGDARIKTVALLTSNGTPTGDARKFLETSGVPIFAVASTEDVNYNTGSLAEATRNAYLFSANKESQLILYDNAGRGSELVKEKPELQGILLRWLESKLGNEPAKESASR